jgi:hypothetical protein
MFLSGGSSLVYVLSSHSSNSLVYTLSSHSSNSLVYAPSAYTSNSLTCTLSAHGSNFRGYVASTYNSNFLVYSPGSYSSDTPQDLGNQTLAPALLSQVPSREPTLIDINYYTASPSPSPLLPSPSRYNVQGYTIPPYRQSSPTLN